MKATKFVLFFSLIFLLACQEEAPNEPNNPSEPDDGNTTISWEPLSLNITGDTQSTGSERVFGFDSEGNYYAGDYKGIYKSTDKGESWTKISSFSYITSDINGNIYAKGFDDDENWYFYHRSSDFGETWEKYCRALYEDEIGTIRANSKGNIIVWKSDDGYSDHLDIYNSGWTQNIFVSEGEFIDGFFISSKDIIFCNADSKIYRSSDNGNTWIELELLSGWNFTFCEDELSNYYLAQDDKVYISSDDGVSWSLVAEGIDDVSLRGVDENKIFFSSTVDGGSSLYVTETLFSDYIKVNYPISSIGSVFANGNVLFVQTNDRGIYYSYDYGDSWQSSTLNPRKPSFHNWNSIAVNNQEIIHVGYYYSKDNGNTWYPINITFPASFNIASDQAGMFYLFAGLGLYYFPESLNKLEYINNSPYSTPENFLITETDRMILNDNSFIWVSDDKGVTWKYTAELPGYWSERMIESENGYLYLNYWQKGLYISKDDGATWNWRNLEAYGNIVDVACGNENAVYIMATDGRKILKSTDFGETWNEHLDFKDQEISYKVLFIDSKNTIFIGGENKMIYTTNSGEEWLDLEYQYIWNGPRIVESPTGEIYLASESNWIMKGTY